MDQGLATTLVSTAGSVLVGIFGMFFTANQLGRRIDDLNNNLRDLRGEFNTFRDTVNGKLSALDLEIARLMDRLK